MSVHQLKDGRWFVQYPNPNGDKPRLIREYFGRGPFAQINAEKRNESLNLKQTRPVSVDKTGPLFFELAAEYQLSRYRKEGLGRAESHLKNRLKNIIIPRIGKIQGVEITHGVMSQYVTERMEHLKRSTVHREVTTIKAILNWATKRRPPLIPYNPIRDFVFPPGESEVLAPPSPQEIEAILKYAPDHLVRAIKTAYYTGLRPGAVELLSLTWGSVLWDRNIIRIVSAKKGGPVLRDVPIHPDFMPLLQSWWEADDHGFGPIFHWRGKPVKWHIIRAWEAAKKRAGITRKLRMYDLRHDFVTTALESGIDIKTLSEIVGSSPETLRRHYQHVSGASRVKAIETIRPLLNGNHGNTAGNQHGITDQN